MKAVCLSIVMLLMLGSNLTFTLAADDRNAVNNVVDVIIEKSPDGSYVQVADYSIGSIDEVLINEGGEVHEGELSDLYVGALVKISLTGKNSSGIWSASKITVYGEEAQSELFATLPSNIKKLLEETAQGSKRQEKIPEGKATGTEDNIRYENGVWIN